MKTDDFDYELPKELIAQTPLENRNASRMMILDKNTGEYKDDTFTSLIDYLNEGDTLVLNDTKSAIWAASASLRAGVSCFESFSPHILGLAGSATAHTVRGPAMAPLPTSSTPRTTPSPPSSRWRSYIPLTRSRSDNSRSRRLLAAATACCTCFRGSSP